MNWQIGTAFKLPPVEIMQKAHDVGNWFLLNSIKHWQLGAIESRDNPSANQAEVNELKNRISRQGKQVAEYQRRLKEARAQMSHTPATVPEKSE